MFGSATFYAVSPFYNPKLQNKKKVSVMKYLKVKKMAPSFKYENRKARRKFSLF